MRELAADQDSEQARKGEGTGRGDKHPEAAQAWVCREEQRRHLGFVAKFRQEDRHKNGPQPHHSLPLLLKTGPNAGAWADAGSWEANEFFIVGIKQVVDGAEDLPVSGECPGHHKINASVGIERLGSGRNRRIRHCANHERLEVYIQVWPRCPLYRKAAAPFRTIAELLRSPLDVRLEIGQVGCGAEV